MLPRRSFVSRLPALALTGLAICLASACRLAESEPPPILLSADLRRAQEVDIDANGQLRPRFVGRRNDIYVCVEPGKEESTSQWQARFALGRQPRPADPPRPAVHSFQQVCFGEPIPADLQPNPALILHGVIYRHGQQVHEIEPQIFAYQLDDRDFGEWVSEDQVSACQPIFSSIGRRCDSGLDWLCFQIFLACQSRLAANDPQNKDLAGDFDALEELAKTANLPLTAVKQKAIAAFFFRQKGSPEAFAEARSRLASLPPWIEQRPADEAHGIVHQTRGDLAAAHGDLKTALGSFEQSTQLLRRAFSVEHLSNRFKRAKIIGLAGSEREAIESLEATLEDCTALTCRPALVAAARGDIAWWTLLDPQSSKQEIAAEAESLESVLHLLASEGPVATAIQLINLAMLYSRLDQDPMATLKKALSLVEGDDSRRARQVKGWSELVIGQEGLKAGAHAQALAHCTHAATSAKNHQAETLEAFAWTCRGRAEQQRKNFDSALAAFRQARHLYESANPNQLSQDISQSPGPRAETYYREASVLLERGSAGDPQRAWRLLAQLDVLPPIGVLVGASDADHAKIGKLRDELGDLEGIAPPKERELREKRKRELREKIQRLTRETYNAVRRQPSPDRELRFRAFTIDDQIFLLHRDSQGRARLIRSTEMASQELRRLTDQLTRALAGIGEPVDDQLWRSWSEPLAAALVPETKLLEDLSSFAMHGVLQAVPLAALPLAEGGWLGDLTTVVVRPAGTSELPPTDNRGGRPLVVVDPTSDLRSGPTLKSFYSKTLPDAHVLYRQQATVAAFRNDLAEAKWLHIDAHGNYFDYFPELSSLKLADGDFAISDLDEVWARLDFANLSSCRTGSWPITANAGRYGIAGHVARLGRPWVLASRTDLTDKLASAFNKAFYLLIADGQAVPEAYRQALAQVRIEQPASEWAALLLLRAAPTPAGVTASGG